jgi:hypothetical protein
LYQKYEEDSRKVLMKKFMVLLILIALGACFFLGWVQYQVPQGSFGVIRSKTHGIDPAVVREGRFRWVWYKLLPTNVKIQIFKTPEISLPLNISGRLPSGDVYASLAGLRTDFSYELKGSVSASIRADALPSLAEEKNLLSQGDLDAYGRDLSSQIGAYINQRFWVYAGNEEALTQASRTGALPALEDDLLARFPELENLDCSVTVLRFPDFVLYGQVRELYEMYLASQRKNLEDGLSRRAAQNIDSQFRFDELSRYGELLTKYPALIQYLALERGIPPESLGDGRNPGP